MKISMGNLKIGHLVEAALWLALAAVLYVYSFPFDKEIEIYKFGASAWPRTVLLLIVIAALGQLAYNWKTGGHGASAMLQAASDDGAEAAARSSENRHNNLKWYLSTFLLLALPLAYLLLPAWALAWFSLDEAALHPVKLGCAGVLIALYLAAVRTNPVGAMLALPVFFGALLSDIGFYSLAPFFVVGVMCLMGERRPGWMALITAIIIGLLLLLFVSVLYVGLPTGNLSPFYEIGTGIVTLLQ